MEEYESDENTVKNEKRGKRLRKKERRIEKKTLKFKNFTDARLVALVTKKLRHQQHGS